jgi:hypothetical protein
MAILAWGRARLDRLRGLPLMNIEGRSRTIPEDRKPCQPGDPFMARLRPIGLSVGALLLAAACSSGGGSTASPASTNAPTAAASTTASAGPSTSVARVSANTASQSEIAAALTAAGVPNADRWAREVIEYRPYDASDATLQKLQDNLAKYNPDPATLAGILSALTP